MSHRNPPSTRARRFLIWIRKYHQRHVLRRGDTLYATPVDFIDVRKGVEIDAEMTDLPYLVEHGDREYGRSMLVSTKTFLAPGKPQAKLVDDLFKGSKFLQNALNELGAFPLGNGCEGYASIRHSGLQITCGV